MKKIHILTALLGLIGSACSNQELEEGYTGKGCVQVSADFVHSRVSFTETDNITYANWEHGESITLNTPTQGSLNYTATVSETAITFAPDGESLKDIAGETVYACYPESTITDGVVALPATNVWTDAQPLPFAYAVSSIASSKVNLTFDHTFAFLKLTLSAEALEKATTTDGDKTVHRLLVKSASESLAVVSGTFKFKDKSINITEASDEIELTLTEAFQPTEESERSIYVPILPQTGDVAMSISLIHNYEGGEDVLLEINKQTPEKGFASGHIYTLTLSNTIINEDSGIIHLAEAGTLSNYITEDNKHTITSLKISGYLNGDDIRLLREMSGSDVYGDMTNGKLTVLDLSKASIVEGGGYYYVGGSPASYYYTQNNVFGDYLFYECHDLSSILFPENIVSIGKQALRSTKLESITIPEKVISIGDNAFQSTDIKEIVIPDHIKSIGEYAFSSCYSLNKATIGKGISRIEAHTFEACTYLQSIIWHDSITSIGNYAFTGCDEFKEIKLPQALKEIGDGAFSSWTKLTKIELPDGVTNIGKEAFYHCTKLKSASLGKSLISIGELAFSGCGDLKEVSIPKTTESIGWGAFGWCSNLVIISGGEGIKTIEGEAFQGCMSIIDFKLGEKVNQIGESAFNDCRSWAIDLKIPGTVETINERAFASCESLKSIELSEGIITIGEEAFLGCDSITEIKIPNSVVSVNTRAFQYCASLKKITIGKNVKEIINLAFSNSPIAECICYAVIPPTIENPGINKESVTLYVPKGSLIAYQESDWATYFGTIVEMEE